MSENFSHYLLNNGGPMIYVILIFMAAAIIIFVERFLVFRRARTDTFDLLNGLFRQLKNDNIKAAIVNCDASGPVGEIFRSAIEHWEDGELAIRFAIEETGRLVIRRLEAHMKLLGCIVSTSPVLGLLGTLFYMIRIFEKMSQNGQFTGTVELAGDIKGALACTAASLIVSLLAYLFYTYLTEKIDSIIQEMGKGAAEITYFLTANRPSAVPDGEVTDLED